MRLYAAAIQAMFGVPPQGCLLKPVHNGHDFGNYLTLALKIEAERENDPAVVAYSEAVEDGLGSWLEAGFGPPIRYLADKSATTEGRDFEDIVMGALRTTRADQGGGWARPDLEHLNTNLAAEFPTLAEAVRQQLELAL